MFNKIINKLTRSSSSSSIGSNKQGTNKQLQQDIDDKLLQKLKNKLDDQQYHLFVQSFYAYLNYNQTKDFVVDLDDIWQWLGYSRKDTCKDMLIRNFIENEDFRICDQNLRQMPEVKKGPQPQQILLNVDTFKNLGMISRTEKGKKIRKYYLSMEESYFEYFKEQSIEYKKKEKSREKYIKNLEDRYRPYEEKPSDELLYIAQSEGSTDNRYKIGKTTKENRHKRLKELNTGNSYNFKYIHLFECMNGILCENFMKNILWDYRRKGEFYEVDLPFAKYVCNAICVLLDELNCCNDNVDLNWISNKLHQNNTAYNKIWIAQEDNIPKRRISVSQMELDTQQSIQQTQFQKNDSQNISQIQVQQWAQQYIEYEENSFLTLEELTQQYNIYVGVSNSIGQQLFQSRFDDFLKQNQEKYSNVVYKRTRIDKELYEKYNINKSVKDARKNAYNNICFIDK